MSTEVVRKDLLEKLETAAPALAIHNLVPVMTHFWFTGKSLMAYNDQIAISVPLTTDFKGAVPGGTLLNLLKATSRSKIELVAGDTELQVKAGSRSTFKLAMLPLPDIFTMPVMDKETGNLGGGLKELLAGVEGCLRSLGADTSIPEQLGVTVVPSDKALHLYTTNSATISKAVVEFKKAVRWKRSCILPTAFCRSMLALCRKAEAGTMLAITKDHALLSVDNTMVWGRLINCEQPFNFEEVIAQHFPDASRKKVVPVPKGLDKALARATIITDAKVDQVRTKATVKDGSLKLASKSDRGEAFDKVKFEGHADCSLSFEPKMVAAGLADFDKLLLTDRCIIMANKNGGLYLVAASS